MSTYEQLHTVLENEAVPKETWFGLHTYILYVFFKGDVQISRIREQKQWRHFIERHIAIVHKQRAR